MALVLWHCWFSSRKGIWPVKTEWWDAGMSSVWIEVQNCILPGWWHCHSLSLASVKSRLVLPFLIPAHPGSPGQRAVKRVCVYRCSEKVFWLSCSSVCSCWRVQSADCKWLWLLSVRALCSEEVGDSRCQSSSDMCQASAVSRCTPPDNYTSWYAAVCSWWHWTGQSLSVDVIVLCALLQFVCLSVCPMPLSSAEVMMMILLVWQLIGWISYKQSTV